MSQTLTSASEEQITFIAGLLQDLHITTDVPLEALTADQAGRTIERLQLRKLSQQLRRPIRVDLTDPAAVSLELERVRQMLPEQRISPANEDIVRRAQPKTRMARALKSTNPAVRAKALADAGVTVRHIAPAPKVALTPQQEAARRGHFDRGHIGPYATGRYSESFGYGGAASRSLQEADARTMGAETLIRRRDATPEMAQFLTRLQRDAGEPITAASDFDDCRSEIDRLKAKLGSN